MKCDNLEVWIKFTDANNEKNKETILFIYEQYIYIYKLSNKLNHTLFIILFTFILIYLLNLNAS
jgi:hypothetical protein